MENSNEKFKKYVDWQKEQHSPKQKLSFLALQEFFHLLVLPTILLLVSELMNTFFDFNLLKILPFPLFIYVGGLLLIVFGLFLSLWSRWIQFKIGQGTPAPKMPTQKLVIKGPYAYCRNPMILGDVIWLIGLGGIFNSISLIVLSIIWFTIHLFYYRFTEEKEMVARFGQEYAEYKNRVPFLIPTFRRKKF